MDSRARLRRMALGLMLVCGGSGAAPVEARIVRIEITERLAPAFGGYAIPAVGAYEKVVGRAYGELDPNDPRNAAIVDLKLAPRNVRGLVEYGVDFYILKPIDATRGNHTLLYEPPNRGRKLTIPMLNRGLGGNDPALIAEPRLLDEAFLLRQGYTLVWSGWDASAAGANVTPNVTISLPIAVNPDGRSITGPAYEYIVTQSARYELHYPAATIDKEKATLTHRVHLDDVAQIVPSSEWTYNADGTAIALLPVGRTFTANDIYEFAYTAKDPTVNGIGFAAVRDFNAFLRYARQDSQGVGNPLAEQVSRAYSVATSQPGRMLNDFRWLGFNESEDGRTVFDGMLQWVAAGDGINMNLRFSQPDRTQRNRQDQLYVEAVFPFANARTFDPISQITAGRYDACNRTNTCPLAMEVFSANEYWVKGASLMHTDAGGSADLPEHAQSRLYFLSSHEHSAPQDPTTRGVCQQFGNPLDPAPVLRALLTALDRWVTQGVAPPASRVPRLADGTLVPALPQNAVGFPAVPGVTYTGLKSTRYRVDYGPDFYRTGVMTINPPRFAPPIFDNPRNGAIYPTFVPRTDVDGNDVAGVRLPDVAVPLATYTGWSLRGGVHANDGCDTLGQMIPFERTAAERQMRHDPRLSVEERYPSLADYEAAAKRAIDALVAGRFMLPEDAEPNLARLVRAAQAAGVR